ncbi:MAG: porin, partial [Gammaproteobacteria bacterium]
MMKKQLPILMAAALAGGVGVATADVAVFCHIDTSLDYEDADGGGGDFINMNCTTCSFGFKGSEDLGNGLKAMFKLDFEYDTTERNSGGSITDRDQWLGLGGVFG